MAKKSISPWIWILIVVVAAFIIIQFFNVKVDYPESDPQKDFLNATTAPDDVRAIMDEACYDCHSYETEFPWYYNLAPASWLVKSDIKDARSHMNLSLWTEYSSDTKGHLMEHATEMVRNEEMPLWRYRLMHEKARLNEEEKQTLISWFEQVRRRLDQGQENGKEDSSGDQHDHGHEH